MQFNSYAQGKLFNAAYSLQRQFPLVGSEIICILSIFFFLFTCFQQFTSFIFAFDLFLYYQLWVIPIDKTNILSKLDLYYVIYFIIPKIEIFYYAWPFIWPIFVANLIKTRNTNWWNKMSAPKDCYLRLQTK